MFRSSMLLLLLAACNMKYNVIDIGDDVTEEDDLAQYDGATLRIVSPRSSSFLPLYESHEFTAELVDANGLPLEVDGLSWSSNVDAAWSGAGLAFEDDSLDVGVHDITAQITLPNGDRLAHTVGGILVQSIYAGTYAGTFSANTEYNGYQIGCAGAALLIVDPYGEVVGGDASCVASLGGYDVQLAFLFDMGNDEGQLSGNVSADLMGWYQLDFPGEGSIEPDTGHLELAFGGDGGFLPMDGSLDAERISRETGAE